ncbi:RNA polymerase-associated protein RapA [Gynuella sunshinyii]|uniref:RNA polymerase-associated protein RapA n=1 Tax=Gynuella sunshinyii YC6258 TaxID=1445510 RepID=A0A0C5VRV3_9GAMM|nr:RNA polymerase-associated protein RapA [Gynuella sunshinyii]AJQ92999.1 superfamily II DNA/RNA helicase, SNF2 family [Gynuella sunshinyii YC6258]
MNFSVGQRWASNTEPQLGLGLITDVSGRRITIRFPAAEEERTYATDTAPLSRIQYSPGDQISNQDGETFTVIEVNELRGILIYLAVDGSGGEIQIPELDLNAFVQFTHPHQRFFGGQLDRNKEYELRVDTLNHQHRLQQSPVRGLMGSRTSLLPHQVYIASEVAGRYAPRVLLADEVGLGKTIEAGMIIHQQLHTGLASRVLILLPTSLVHQWLVEMLRRFNMSFAVFNQERLEAMEETASGNPFETEQRIIVDIDFFQQSMVARQLALDAEWDLVVVDEAHHLAWSETEVSSEYLFVEQLAQQSKGLLLLTATPEQIGIEGHFARLRLLDPARFHSLDAFRQEAAHYGQLNELVKQVVVAETLNEELRIQLREYLGDEMDADTFDSDQIIRHLLDRHGTGRVLFRNTRAAIKGFPQRCLNAYPLPQPDIYQGIDGQFALYPETLVEEEQWISDDPRVEWLVEHLKALKVQKVLVICHNAATALALDKYLTLRVGIRSASFYEGLSIIERDRAAAYFADQDQGAQTLICSEIGSEGRNFQFAHHLVLFDLPLNPDLLEQRIGRLDRIGQQHDIQIHVPYLLGTAQESLYRWFHEGINLFQQSCSAGYMIFQKFQQPLEALLLSGNQANLDHLIQDTRVFTEATLEELHNGRDQLLERNSCDMKVASDLIERIQQEEQSDTLFEYMESLFDNFGLDVEDHSEHALVITPSDNMRTQHFPGLKDEGNTVTFDRQRALSREDMDYLTWEHPMVYENMDVIISSELGNANLAQMSLAALPAGTLLLEAWYCMHSAAPGYLQLERYLPLSPTRYLIDPSGKNLSAAVSYEKLAELCEPIRKQMALQVIPQIRGQVEQMLQHAQHFAGEYQQLLQQQALEQMSSGLEEERNRLVALREVNPNIRQDEIDHLTRRMAESKVYIEKSVLELQALRVVINSGGKK